jgi:pimeloyl-ACP methyl ester carboxylesterase
VWSEATEKDDSSILALQEKRSIRMATRVALVMMFCMVAAVSVYAADIESRVKQGFVDSNGVKIHYASLGSGPLVIMIHGFPDYWYTWRKQMEGLSDKYQCVAIDQRGYNLSDKPEGVDNYAVPLLVGDVIAVIKHFGKDKAIIVGHDWGGVVAWGLALNAPQYVDRLIILNLPHPRGIARELAHNPKQQAASQYARNFQQEGAEKALTPEMLAFWVTDPEAKQKYVEAFKRSDLKAMLNYYKRNYPREPYQEDTSPVVKTQMPVLMIHGLKDTALLSDMLNNTWDWTGKDLTLVTIPESGHFVQQDAADLVTKSMRMWLER